MTPAGPPTPHGRDPLPYDSIVNKTPLAAEPSRSLGGERLRDPSRISQRPRLGALSAPGHDPDSFGPIDRG